MSCSLQARMSASRTFCASSAKDFLSVVLTSVRAVTLSTVEIVLSNTNFREKLVCSRSAEEMENYQWQMLQEF